MDVKPAIRAVLPKRVKGYLKGIAWSLVQGEAAAAQQDQIRRQLDDYLTRLDFARAQTKLRAEREMLNRLLGLWGKQTVW